MSTYLSMEQQRSIVRRFKTEYSRQVTNGTWHYSTNSYCRMCKPENGTISDKVIVTTNQHRVYPVWNAGPDMASWAAESYKAIEVMNAHLSECHEVSPCNICSELVTRRGLRRLRLGMTKTF